MKRCLSLSLDTMRSTPSQPLKRSDCEHHEAVLDDSEGIRFKAAAPRAFAHLRSLFGVSDSDYKQSICGEDELIEVVTPGKSGAVFFKTADGRFIIKTVSKVESKFLRSMLFDYVQHIKDLATDRLRTLLPQFYDLVHINTVNGRNIRLVVMNNLRPSGLSVHEVFDLKGSTVGRWASEQEKAQPGGCVLKDLDFKHSLHVGPSDYELIREQLAADSAFLKRQGVIDYSLLCMLHFIGRPGLEPRAAQLAPNALSGRSRRGERVEDAPEAEDGLSSSSGSSSDGTILSAAPTVSRDDSSVSSMTDFTRRLADTDASIMSTLHKGQPCATTEPLRGINGALQATTADGAAVVIYCGVIDVLQPWRLRKMAEHTLKSAYYVSSNDSVSVVPPDAYAERFVKELTSKFSANVPERARV